MQWDRPSAASWYISSMDATLIADDNFPIGRQSTASLDQHTSTTGCVAGGVSLKKKKQKKVKQVEQEEQDGEEGINDKTTGAYRNSLQIQMPPPEALHAFSSARGCSVPLAVICDIAVLKTTTTAYLPASSRYCADRPAVNNSIAGCLRSAYASCSMFHARSIAETSSCCPAGAKIAPGAINVMSGKTYEQEFDLEQQRMAVSSIAAY